LKIADLPIPEDAKLIISKAGFEELYPPQREAIEAGVLDGKNLVLASPTASGKTLVAELCAIIHIVERGGKVLYLTPLRALASEKYDDFKKYTALRRKDGRRLRLGITTGDYDGSDPWLNRYDIIISTNEKADSLLRHRADWISDVTLVVADEIHLLNDGGRGPTLEVTLAKLIDVNPGIQILALSATVRNADEIANWLKATSITTDWRPVKLLEGVCLREQALFNDGSAITIVEEDQNPVTNFALNITVQGGQALIFADTRRQAVAFARKAAKAVNKTLSKSKKCVLKTVADRILSSGEKTRIGNLLADLVSKGVAFHHAGLKSQHRKIIEDAFRERRLKIISATPTLAAGVNLPARRVIISSYRRYEPGYGWYPISVLEYKQMSGRAGRPRYDSVGEALLISKNADEQDYLMNSYVLAEPERIWSRLAAENVLRSHVLATIASGFAKTEQGLFEFFDRTLNAHQYGSRNLKELLVKVLKFLYKEEMVNANGSYIEATEFGRRVSELYIDPVSGVIFRDGFYARSKALSDLSLLHMVCRTPDLYPKNYPRSRELKDLVTFVEVHRDEFVFEVPSEWDDRIKFESFLGEVKSALILDAWNSEVSEDGIIEKFSVEPGDLFRLVESAKWLLHAAHELCRLFGHKDLIPRISELEVRTEFGVKKELIPLVRLAGVGRVRGRMLFNAGFKTIDDLKKAPLNRLQEIPYIGPKMAKNIKEQIGGVVNKEEWDRLKEDVFDQRVLSDY